MTTVSRVLAFKWAVAVILVGVGVYVAFIGSFEFISSPDVIRAAVEDAGAVGPLIIVVSIAIAVVISPLPSAPLTAISGAAYGHIWGTVYALIGAQIGAMII